MSLGLAFDAWDAPGWTSSYTSAAAAALHRSVCDLRIAALLCSLVLPQTPPSPILNSARKTLPRLDPTCTCTPSLLRLTAEPR